MWSNWNFVHHEKEYCVYMWAIATFTAQSFVILGKVEYTKSRTELQAAKCVLTDSYEKEYFLDESNLWGILPVLLSLYFLLTQASYSGIHNSFLFPVSSSDHHSNEAYDWWPFADLWWDIKCVLSDVSPRVPASSELTDIRHCSTHYSSLQATAASNGHTLLSRYSSQH